ncbi:dihydroorotase [Aquimarina muelleri]|uniref:Dihydroorotase n=1 Tax=Aquimarina muelleri TaxID=279356 RepID=A0A918N2Q9_9FLAO|nr:dihydroorotase [Aquimarina muelleri]MCX2762101.1 dihydroorotase [Aquimarina muelleri]GGX04482.1 dihydroorotase [Aquimarina muelleri]
MNFLLKAATVIDPKSPFHNQTVDILIKNGTITDIDTTIKVSKDTEEVKLHNLHISQGWFDSSVCFGEPGYEERETILHGLQVAAKSGFTAIALHPNTFPIADNSASIGFLKSKAYNNAISLYPIGALTMQSTGIDLAELYDMQQAGAIAFGDYKKAIKNPNLLKIALLYAQNFNGLVLSYPQENDIAGKGIVNEEEQSTLLGLKGIPALAEELQISRDLFLLEYTGGALHIPTISTAKSVDLIREAKKKGLQVSCSTTVHNITLTDKELTTFDTCYKVQPPLRTQKDIDALLKGIADGTIDMITSDHRPMDIENKKVEFDNAKYGTIGLESSFGTLNELLGIDKTVEILTKGKSVFKIKEQTIDKGNIADLSLFNPEGSTTFTEKDILSTSKNSALIGKPIKGTSYGIIANNKIVLK